MAVTITAILLLLFLLTGVPVAFAMGISGAIGLYFVGGFNTMLGIFQTTPYPSVADFSFLAIPMFILMAEFLTASDITKDLFRSGQKWLGHYPGGLGIATVFAAAGLGAISGSSTGSAATMSAAAVPEMKKYGYSPSMALGLVSIAGTLAIMIPPSTILIFFGIITETDIRKLLMAGFIPGIITALGYIFTILVWTKVRPMEIPKMEPAPFKERLLSIRYLWPAILLFILVFASLFFGVVTATEASALGALGAFMIALLMRRLSLKKTSTALEQALKTSTMIFTIIIGAMILSYFLTMTGLTQSLVGFVGSLPVSGWIILTIIVVIYLLLGLFMDQVAILVLTLPLTFPIIMELGYNPIWFGVIVTKTVEIGLVSPPLGLNVFVASSAVGEKAEVAFRGIWPFVVVDLLVLVLLILFPILSIFIPSIMFD